MLLSSFLSMCRSHPQAFASAGPPNGQTVTRLNSSHDIQELEISAIHSLIKLESIAHYVMWVLGPQKLSAIRLPLSSALLRGRARCNRSSRQIRCNPLVVHAPAHPVSRRPIDKAAVTSRTCATCQRRGMLLPKLCASSKIQPTRAGRALGVCGSVLSRRQGAPRETRESILAEPQRPLRRRSGLRSFPRQAP